MKPSRYSAVQLLVALCVLFVSSPVVEDLPSGDFIEALLLTIVMVFAVLAIGGGRRTLIIAIVLLSLAAVAKWMDRFRPGLLPPHVFPAAAVIFFGFIVVHLLRFILRAQRVDTNVLCAGVSGYLMLGLLWMPAYLLAARLTPGAFAFNVAPDAADGLDGFHAFYFSFITLSTVGYGDITPVSEMARMLAVSEAIVGVFYVAVVISRLVAIYSSTSPASKTDP